MPSLFNDDFLSEKVLYVPKLSIVEVNEKIFIFLMQKVLLLERQH